MERKIRPYVLAETNWKHVKDEDFSVSVLPWGATEAHNYHLPYATDNILAEEAAIYTAGKAWKKKAKVVVLPTIPFGVNTGQMDVKLCMNLNPSTQYAILKDVAQVLQKHKINKLVILNSHGGNNFKQMIRELSLEYPKLFACSVNWWQTTDARPYFDEPGDHAGELETAAVMHLRPELVLPLKEAGDGSAKTFKIKALKEGWASAQREWTSVTKDTGVGNPKAATAEKGKRFIEKTTDMIADFFVELHSADLEDMYH
ncbi:creatininase family protein [Salegentibacter mishustinae]|uniref:creatininase family protein n=1 Tax=Salegentibacter mishustinae TaxID=270918 RepID=UPI000AAEA1B4|nr:creatininase family protein [Salegentibacter mishustinae]PZX67643.1 creatinine amidohydrolase [Salegentibacter mishustinae]GGW78360.1 amidase [Salegentibacter mishustinae]